MKQTAVEWLYDEIKHIIPNDLLKTFKQAKAMEKEQIIEAFENGLYDGDGRNRSHYNMNSEQYYNETFKSE